MNSGLAGRLEAVLITTPTSNHCSYGELMLDRTPVLITNANPYRGEICLVHFDLNQRLALNQPRGNFITSIIPDNFRGLAPEEYLLYGLWEEYMEKAGKYPTLLEINRYFDPGDMPWVYHFQRGSDKGHGRVLIIPEGVSFKSKSISERIQTNLPDPRRSSRVLLVEDPANLEEVTKMALAINIVPICMEPLQ